jgi:hypothetical protein
MKTDCVEKFGSRSLWLRRHGMRCLAALAFGAVAGGGAGCFVVFDGHDRDDGTVVADSPEEVNIDPGALEADPGEGVGVFVEHNGEGEWHVWTTCDTEKSGTYCPYDIFLSGNDLSYVTEEDLEDDDTLETSFEEARLYINTDNDTDGVRFSTDNGAPLIVEVYLDGQPASEFLYWLDNGEVWTGAPSNPVAFVP